MIKSTELRIGNWVKKHYIRSNNDRIINEPMFSWDFTCMEMEPNFYEPIPLTEDILLKCGFVKTENNIFVLNDFWFINGNLSMNRPDIKRTKRLGRPLKYFIHAFIKSDINSLHQLQNLIFALTGEELIFNN